MCARHAERVAAVARSAAAPAGVEEVEPVVAADDPRSLNQAAFPAVAVPHPDLAGGARQSPQGGAQAPRPDRGWVVAARFLSHPGRAARGGGPRPPGGTPEPP